MDPLQLIGKPLYRTGTIENSTTHNLIKEFSTSNKLHNNEYLRLAPHHLKSKRKKRKQKKKKKKKIYSDNKQDKESIGILLRGVVN